MPLPVEFQFTQANLQDYTECRRRFQLRYLLHLAWPAVAAEPIEDHDAHLRDGEAFHRLIHQHQLGLPLEHLTAQVEAGLEEDAESPLAGWWQNYRSAPPADLPRLRYPEITLTAPAGAHRLAAKYDLITIEPGSRAVIVDWKTSAHRPAQAWLAARLQTRVYRYLLVQAGAHLNEGRPIAPAQVTMVYWFANHPDQPERLRYDATQHAADGRHLAALIGEIAAAGDDDFALTTDIKHCRFCAYRSLCGRGVEAGALAEAEVEVKAEEDWAGGFDFEQVAEVAF